MAVSVSGRPTAFALVHGAARQRPVHASAGFGPRACRPIGSVAPQLCGARFRGDLVSCRPRHAVACAKGKEGSSGETNSEKASSDLICEIESEEASNADKPMKTYEADFYEDNPPVEEEDETNVAQALAEEVASDDGIGEAAAPSEQAAPEAESRLESKEPESASVPAEYAEEAAQLAATGIDGELSSAQEDLDAVREDLKEALLDAVFGTDRGISASAESRAEILEIIGKLESCSPTNAPATDSLIQGSWRLLYTSNSELSLLLGGTVLPLVEVGEIYQIIEGDKVENKCTLGTPGLEGTVSASARLEVRSGKRVDVIFNETTLYPPTLNASVPSSVFVPVVNQAVDLSALKGVLQPFEDALETAADTIARQDPVRLPITLEQARGWLLTTYLDDDLRVSRGDGGSLFVLQRTYQ